MNPDISPRVTVVTPVFNGSDFVSEAILSILDQTYSNLEYIVIDGGSTDGTVDIVKKYLYGIDYFVTEKDEGMYHAINKGFAKATGTILCYLNCDDIFEKTAVEEAVKGMMQTGAGISIANCIYIDKNGDELYRYKGIPFDYDECKKLCRIPFAQQTAFWSKELYDKVGGFDSSLRYVADTKFFYSLLKLHGKAPAYVDQYIARFRLHDMGFTRKEAGAMKKEHLRVLDELNISCGFSHYLTELKVKWVNRCNIVRRYI